MITKTYRVLIDAPFVAGQRSPGKDETLRLTDAEAEHALILGHVAEVSDGPAEGGSADTPPTKRSNKGA